MKLATANTLEYDSSPINESQEATITGDAHIFELLAKMYSRPEEAVLRETLCNGHDAQIEQGTQDVPLYLKLPTMLDPSILIRDNGTGLSKHDCLKLFTCYGYSTKRQLMNSVGFFGIGSKAFFAVTDSAIITSRHNGKKYVFSFAKNAERKPVMNLLHEMDTIEPSGLEISYAVPKDRVSAYSEAAQRLLPRLLTRMKIDAHGLSRVPDPIEYVAEGSCWKVRSGMESYYADKTPVVIMGGIGYPVSVDVLRHELPESQRELLSMGFDIEVPLGSCRPVPSREGLEYDEPTRKYLKQVFSTIRNELVDAYQKEFSQCKSLWEARCFLYEKISQGSMSESMRKLLRSSLLYNGIKVDYNTTLDVGLRAGVRVGTTQVKYFDKLIMRNKEKISAKSNTYFYINDVRQLGHFRISEHVKANLDDADLVVAIRATEPNDIKEILDELGNPPHVLTSTLPQSSVEKVDPSQRKVTTAIRNPVKQILEFRGSYFYDTSHDVTDGGLYVNTYRQDPVTPDGKRIPNFANIISSAQAVGVLPEDTKIFGIQKTYENIPKTVKGWRPVMEVVTDGFSKLDLHTIYMNSHLMCHFEKFTYLFERISNDGFNLKRPSHKRSLFNRLLDEYLSLKEKKPISDPQRNNLTQTLTSLGMSPPDLADKISKSKTIKLLNEAIDTYPLLWLHLNNARMYTPEEKTWPKYLQYIEIVDRSPTLVKKFPAKV